VRLLLLLLRRTQLNGPIGLLHRVSCQWLCPGNESTSSTPPSSVGSGSVVGAWLSWAGAVEFEGLTDGEEVSGSCMQQAFGCQRAIASAAAQAAHEAAAHSAAAVAASGSCMQQACDYQRVTVECGFAGSA
jgi:hypothetical protein